MCCFSLPACHVGRHGMREQNEGKTAQKVMDDYVNDWNFTMWHYTVFMLVY